MQVQFSPVDSWFHLFEHLHVGSQHCLIHKLLVWGELAIDRPAAGYVRAEVVVLRTHVKQHLIRAFSEKY